MSADPPILSYAATAPTWPNLAIEETPEIVRLILPAPPRWQLWWTLGGAGVSGLLNLITAGIMLRMVLMFQSFTGMSIWPKTVIISAVADIAISVFWLTIGALELNFWRKHGHELRTLEV